MPTLRYMPDKDSIAHGTWRGHRFGAGQAITVRNEALLADLPEGFVVERTQADRAANKSRLKR